MSLSQNQRQDTADFRDNFRRGAMLVGVGWMGTYIIEGLMSYPMQFLLKDSLKLTPSELASFGFFGNIAGYIKPLLGILSDAFPLFGTKRRHYLLVGLFGSGVLYILLGLAPRAFGPLLATNILLYGFLNLVSTIQGGMMVDVGQRHKATGRMSAQRIGLARLSALMAVPVGALLAKRIEFHWMTLLVGGLYLAMVLLMYREVQEPRMATVQRNVLEDAARQLRALARSRTLLSAAGAVMLVVMAPGFGTPLFFYQTNVLRFSSDLLGLLAFINALFSMAGAALYALLCRRMNLRALLAWSIVIHTFGTLFYLLYRSPATALWITALEGIAQTLAILPLYDLAARATPKGSEALGYALMMSSWNLTQALSNWFGSYLYDVHHLTFMQLVWLNAGTTALVLFIVPLLPVALMSRREGEESVLDKQIPDAPKDAPV